MPVSVLVWNIPGLGLERRPLLASVLVPKKFSSLDLGHGLEASGFDYNTAYDHHLVPKKKTNECCCDIL